MRSRHSWRWLFAGGWATAVAGILIGLAAEPDQKLAGLSFCLTVGGLGVLAAGLLLGMRSRDRTDRTQ